MTISHDDGKLEIPFKRLLTVTTNTISNKGDFAISDTLIIRSILFIGLLAQSIHNKLYDSNRQSILWTQLHCHCVKEASGFRRMETDN
ncbi:hypothetical protein Glove_86g162 [Diversispora epigaea]|uniref:Uncharacterized protein n=1 Tax=Diversispora epigaea TaxID=1348612 RepID=A0A397J6J3_9GLOM|nr:hypothetical protein Glove_86g162 [Diversispora epigaea]